MIAVLVTLAVLALLAVGLVLADRTGAAVAERKASAALSTPFGHPATVRVHGTPFLTQALRGRYGEVEVLGTLTVGEIAGATLVAHLRNVYLPLRDLIGRRVRELPCEHVQGRVVLPYGELARVARIPGLALRFEGERLMASAALPVPEVPGLGAMVPGLGAMVPGIGQLARVSGEAALSLRAGGEVWLKIRHVSVAGISLPSIVLNQLVPSLDVPIPLPSLPYGLRLDELRPTATGLVVDGSADAVVFRAGESRPRPADATGGARRPAPPSGPPTTRSTPRSTRRPDPRPAERPTGQDGRPGV